MEFKDISDKIGDFAQNTVEKGQNAAHAAKLSIDVNLIEDKIKFCKARIGDYVAEKRLFSDDANIAALYAELDGYNSEIALLENKINALKDIVACPKCSKKYPLGTKFCSDCGATLPVTQL